MIYTFSAHYTQGDVRMGLTVLCHAPPGQQILCIFTVPHASWLAGIILMVVGVLLVGLSICLLVVALHKRRKAFEQGAKWTGLSGGVSVCTCGANSTYTHKTIRAC